MVNFNPLTVVLVERVGSGNNRRGKERRERGKGGQGARGRSGEIRCMSTLETYRIGNDSKFCSGTNHLAL